MLDFTTSFLATASRRLCFPYYATTLGLIAFIGKILSHLFHPDT